MRGPRSRDGGRKEAAPLFHTDRGSRAGFGGVLPERGVVIGKTSFGQGTRRRAGGRAAGSAPSVRRSGPAGLRALSVLQDGPAGAGPPGIAASTGMTYPRHSRLDALGSAFMPPDRNRPICQGGVSREHTPWSPGWCFCRVRSIQPTSIHPPGPALRGSFPLSY